MAVYGIARHPFLFWKQGVVNFRILLLRCPARLGLHKSQVNPLGRDALLPPLLGAFPAPGQILARVHRVAAWSYKPFLCGVPAAAPLAPWLGGKSNRRTPRIVFGYVLLVGLYARGQIEEPDGRYVLPFLPALALLTSSTLTILANTIQSDRKP